MALGDVTADAEDQIDALFDRCDLAHGGYSMAAHGIYIDLTAATAFPIP